MIVSMLWIALMPAVRTARAQATSQATLSEQIQGLTNAIARTQSQLDESQRELNEMRKQLDALQGQVARGEPAANPPATQHTADSSSAAAGAPETTAAEIDDLRERETVAESEIATHEQDKVESESKYPVKITGMLLLNGFVNTNAVNAAATPAIAVPGSGSTGASARQTVLGFDARGPHLFGARTYADLRVDFAGNPQASASSAAYNNGSGTLLRLRTMHAALQWSQTEAFFSLDRPITSPDTPTSLTAVSEPALAWSGNLWTWNPQVGVRQNLRLGNSRDMNLEATLIDVGDAPLSPSNVVASGTTPTVSSSGEQSRWPGVEARVSVLRTGTNEAGSHIGVGGFFAPHRTALGDNFDSWAATLDARLLLPAHFEMTASAYRGLALGGLGGGAYKDFAYAVSPASGKYYFTALDDAGGWVELKEKFSQRFEANAAFGMDNVFSHELRPYAAAAAGNFYQGLARNHTYTGNLIFSPSAYLLFSLEYRHIESTPVVGAPSGSNVIGLGAGYKF
ncbi:MAG: hypothetical protein WBE38_02160 [Terracidiphilus sp.]